MFRTALFLLAAFGANAQACDFSIFKTELPLQEKTQHENLCLSDYFAARDLGRISLGEDHRNPNKPVLFRDTAGMRFSEMMLFEAPQAPSPLGKDGRLALARELIEAHAKSLRNDYGACKLEIRNGDRVVELKDFTPTEREVNSQPGSRLMLTSELAIDPHWQLRCPGPKGEERVEKSGSYYFVFADIYESPDHSLKGNLAQYLFSFQ